MARGDNKPVKRKHLALTWLHRVLTHDERGSVATGVRIEAHSATVEDGTLHVLRMEGQVPENAPPGMHGALAVRVTHVPRGGAGIVEGAVTPPVAKGGRAPTIAELDEVVHRFARGRLMALMFDGGGLPVEGEPTYWELVEIAGLVGVGGEEPAPGPHLA